MKKTSPNNLKCGFVLTFLSLNAEGVCGEAFDSSLRGRGQGVLGGEKKGIEAEIVSYSFPGSEILGGETHHTGWFHVSWAS